MKKGIDKRFRVFKPILITFSILLFGIFSCNPKHELQNELLLDDRYKEVQNISTSATCTGPTGNFTTLINSTKNGDQFFTQIYGEGVPRFKAVVTAENKGFVIDQDNNRADSLSTMNVAMIKSHDFHRIQMDPGSFFDDITYNSKLDNGTELFTSRDLMDNPARLYYDRDIKQVIKIELINMMDTTQTIEIHHKKWTDSKFGKVVSEIEIIQAGRDTFNYSFDKIELNSND